MNEKYIESLWNKLHQYNSAPIINKTEFLLALEEAMQVQREACSKTFREEMRNIQKKVLTGQPNEVVEIDVQFISNLILTAEVTI